VELRDFADQVLTAPDLQAKIGALPEPLTDRHPGEPFRPDRPTRPPRLQFAQRRTAPAMPKAAALKDPAKRAIAHHIMANHELQALEVMAMIATAFPDAPAEFRHGLGEIMQDEQRHTRMHVQRAEELGLSFGDLPVNGYIWAKAVEYSNILEYICGLPLVFEGGNLDHTAEFEHYFVDAGDRRSAAIMRAIQRDEIRHVEFGMIWLRRLKPPGMDDFTAWIENLKWPIRPSKARGREFLSEPRQAAGMSDDFINQLRQWSEAND
jgi:uncharacterized ferritin-like protein (DUF455 family)